MISSMPEPQRKIIVLDTSAFIAGFDPFSVKEQEYTVPLVIKEISEKTMSYLRFKTAEENGKLKVATPNEEFTEQVKKCATTVGDSFFLSKTDIQLLALSAEFKMQGYCPLIATDDYSIQNVARRMGIESAPLGTLGIRRHLEWMRYCPACHKRYPANYRSRTCEICGTPLKRKPLKNKDQPH